MESSGNMKTYWLKIIGIISCLYGLFQTCNSWMSFTYFTVLSNILVLIVLTYFLFNSCSNSICAFTRFSTAEM